MGFWTTTIVFFLAGVVASFSVRVFCNRGPSTNLFHLTLIITATICCWMIGGSSSKRPPGVKKAKMKKKNDEQIAKVIQINSQLVEATNASTVATTKMTDAMIYKQETKILFKDLNSISDPMMRDYIRNEQIRIMQKRMEVQGSCPAAHQGEGSQSSPIQRE